MLRFAVATRKGMLAAAAALLAGHQAAEAAVPVLIGVVIDRAVEPGSGEALVTWLLALGVLFAALSLCFRFGARLSQRVALLSEHELRQRLVRRLLERRGGDAGLLPGAALNLATSDASRVAFVNATLAVTVAALTAFVVAAAVLIDTSLALGLLVLIGLPPLLVGLHLAARPLERRSHAEQAAAAHAAGTATDLVSGLRVLKGLGAEAAAAGRYRAASRTSLEATLRAARAQAAYNGTAVGAIGVFLALVALVGGRLAAEGQISIGELVAALGLTQFLVGPIGRLGAAAGAFAQARASAARIAAALETHDLEPSVPAATVDRGILCLHLPGVTLTVSPGEIVGIVAGPADATRLVDALAAVDDQQLLSVPHDADLFSGSLVDNVAAPAPDPSLVGPALAAATADQVADLLPSGVQSGVGERGRLLSGGQQQRVALARALATGAPALVLHDPTTAVDPVTEAQIADGIRRIRADAATVLITTSPTLLAHCHRVVVVDGEHVPLEGTHRRLLRDAERYRELVLA